MPVIQDVLRIFHGNFCFLAEKTGLRPRQGDRNIASLWKRFFQKCIFQVKEEIMSRKIVVVNKTLNEEKREQIRYLAEQNGYEVLFFEKNEDALDAVKDAEVAYGWGTDLTKAGKELLWFNSISAGVDNFLKEGAIANPDMILTSSSGAYGITLAEHAIMVTLEVLRRQPEYLKNVFQKKWTNGLAQKSIKGSNVTILGTGDIGSEIAKRIASFDPAQIVGISRSGKSSCRYFNVVRKPQETENLLPETDILIMALPGTSETWHFMDEKRIALLPSDAIVVNVGRGNALDQNALAQALREDRLWGAALDVFESEPLSEDDPLWDCPKLLITPHIAGALTNGCTVERNYELFMENLHSYLNGGPLKRVIDHSIGY